MASHDDPHGPSETLHASDPGHPVSSEDSFHTTRPLGLEAHPHALLHSDRSLDVLHPDSHENRSKHHEGSKHGHDNHREHEHENKHEHEHENKEHEHHGLGKIGDFFNKITHLGHSHDSHPQDHSHDNHSNHSNSSDHGQGESNKEPEPIVIRGGGSTRCHAAFCGCKKYARHKWKPNYDRCIDCTHLRTEHTSEGAQHHSVDTGDQEDSVRGHGPLDQPQEAISSNPLSTSQPHPRPQETLRLHSHGNMQSHHPHEYLRIHSEGKRFSLNASHPKIDIMAPLIPQLQRLGVSDISQFEVALDGFVRQYVNQKQSGVESPDTKIRQLESKVTELTARLAASDSHSERSPQQLSSHSQSHPSSPQLPPLAVKIASVLDSTQAHSDHKVQVGDHKASAANFDEAEVEEPKINAKIHEPKSNGPKVESKVSEPTVGDHDLEQKVHQVDNVKVDSQKVENLKVDHQINNNNKDDKHKVAGHKFDEHKVDEHKVGEHKVDEHKVDEHKVDEHKVDEHKVDEHKVNEHKVEHKANDHEVSEHKVDEHKADVHKAGVYKAVEHTVDEHKANDEPKVNDDNLGKVDHQSSGHNSEADHHKNVKDHVQEAQEDEGPLEMEVEDLNRDQSVVHGYRDDELDDDSNRNDEPSYVDNDREPEMSVGMSPVERFRELHRDRTLSDSRNDSYEGDRTRAESLDEARPSGTEQAPPAAQQAQGVDLNSDKAKAHRQKVVQEFVDTERSYVSSLDILCNTFVLPMKKLTEVPSDKISELVSNLETLVNFHHVFLVDLMKDAVERGPAQVVLRYAEYFKLYTAYLQGYEKMVLALEALKKLKRFQKALADTTAELAKAGSLDLLSYIIMPVQRIPRYVLLLRELLRYTAPDHSEHKSLVEALAKMEEMGKFINESKRQTESMTRLLEIAQSISGDHPPLVVPHRRLLRRDVIVIRRKKFEEGQVFLFNDILLWTSPTLRCEGCMTLTSVTIANKQGIVEITDPHNNKDNSNELAFKFRGDGSVEAAATWTEEANKAVEASKRVRAEKMQRKKERMLRSGNRSGTAGIGHRVLGRSSSHSQLHHPHSNTLRLTHSSSQTSQPSKDDLEHIDQASDLASPSSPQDTHDLISNHLQGLSIAPKLNRLKREMSTHSASVNSPPSHSHVQHSHSSSINLGTPSGENTLKRSGAQKIFGFGTGALNPKAIGMLSVVVERANHLPALNKNGMCDAYCSLSLEPSGDQKQKTACVDDLNPIWGTEFCFAINDLDDAVLIKVKARHDLPMSNSTVGTLSINAKIIANAEGGTLRQSWPLEVKKSTSTTPTLTLTCSFWQNTHQIQK